MHIVFVYCLDEDPGEYTDYLLRLLAKPGENSCNVWTSADYLERKTAPTGHCCILVEVKRKTLAGIRLWLRLFLPGLLKKLDADVVILSDGFALPYIAQPQVMLLPPSGYLVAGTPSKKAWQRLSKKDIRKSVNIAAAVVANTNVFFPELEKALNINNLPAQVIPYTADEIFKPLAWHDKTIIKASHTGNKDFFAAVITSPQQDYIHLLKAFSGFKKWQQSSMQLLLIISGDVPDDDIQEKLSTYKYRNDVKLIDYTDDNQTAGIIASAYALLFNNTDEHLLPVVQAMQCGIPLIALKDPLVELYAADATLFTTDDTPTAMTDQMNYLYKNETLREMLSVQGLETSKLYNNLEQQQKLWRILQSAADR